MARKQHIICAHELGVGIKLAKTMKHSTKQVLIMPLSSFNGLQASAAIISLAIWRYGGDNKMNF